MPSSTDTISHTVSVSVIIPTLNEAVCLADTLQNVRAQRPHEIIVVDGGSTDGTCQVAAAADLVLRGPCGRALQMNLGARHAASEQLLFLHADCLLETGAIQDALRLLSAGRVAAGCFTMRVRANGSLYRLIDVCATARVRLTGIAYGDQGLFVSQSTFKRLGGFPPLRLMEDLFFSRTLSQHGRIIVSPRRIYVSPRRWQRTGLMRQTLQNWSLTALTAAGVSPDLLARFYPAVR